MSARQPPDPERWARIQEAFLEAADLAPHELPAALDRICGADDDLRHEVEALLHARHGADEFIGSLALRAGLGFAAPSGQPAKGRRLGAYRLLREIGRGGMGAVYLAERADDQFEKQVAVKLLPIGLGTSAARERFLAERQILAQLEHPGIARLLDGGVAEDGTPFFVMERVDGVPITRYCAERGCTTDERLRLFLQVCEAVEYAHGNLVVHRDIKPDNILVTPAGQALLLDFGIAKALDANADAVSAMTFVAGRPMTPAYASPEQVRNEPVTTATDVYALGMLLYELLAGCLPYEAGRAAPAELERMVCHEPLRRPSVAALNATSATTSGEAARLARRLRGDLDTITLKALQREPSRRYRSAAALADDIRRFLGGLPVSAQPDRWTYRLHKFARRRPAVIVAAAAFVIAATGFSATLLFYANRLEQERDVAQLERGRAEAASARAGAEQARAELEALHAVAAQTLAESAQALAETARRDAEAQRDRARLQTAKAEQVTSFLVSLFEASDPAMARGEDVRASELLDRGVAQISNLSTEPEVHAELLTVLSRVHASLDMFSQARALAEQALRLRRELHGDVHPEVAASLHDLGLILRDARYTGQNNDSAALAYFQRALSMRRALLGDEHADVAYSLVAVAEVGFLLDRDGTRAEPLLRRALGIQRAALGPDHPALIPTLQLLSTALFAQGQRRAADEISVQLFHLKRSAFGNDHPTMVDAHVRIGDVFSRRNDALAAGEHYRQALLLQRKLGEQPRVEALRLHTPLSRVAQHEQRYGDPQAALPLLREALEAVRGRNRTLFSNTGIRMAQLLADRGELDEAEVVMRDVIQHDGTRPSRFSLESLGAILLRKGDLEGARAASAEVLAGYHAVFTTDHFQTAQALVQMGTIAHRQGRLEEAEERLGEAVGMWRRLLAAQERRLDAGAANGTTRVGNTHPDPEVFALQRKLLRDRAAPAFHALAEVLRDLGRTEEAQALGSEGSWLEQEAGTR
jgi:eukaryotic-like serine/threonine-protein kinase